MVKQNPSPPAFLSIGDLMAETGLARGSVEKVLKSGELPCRRIGRRILIEAGAVRKWLAGLPAGF